jgi:coenzyme F420-reducing hydrogenase delta subunit/Pyruvate/2-oxoacid:ferredoxin oxidoreductase delta subunit
MRNGDMQSATPESELKTNKRVLVLGKGLTAKRVVHELGHLGFQSLNLSLDEPPAGQPYSRITDFQGFPGAFRVGVVSRGGERRVEEAGAVVVAVDCLLSPTLGKWGLARSETVWSLSDFADRREPEARLIRSGVQAVRTAVFICGFTHHSYPHTQRKAVECGLELSADPFTRVIFLLEHFKVAQEGVERLMRQAREKGILFVKLSRPGPQIRAAGDRLAVSYLDETLGETLTVSPDLLVVEEACSPALSVRPLAGLLGVTLDSNGFFQGDHIHNRPIFTNRTGIFVVGEAKGPQSQAESDEEAMAVALEALNLLGDDVHEATPGRIGKNVTRCARCLTCYRVCPHRAISHIGDEIPFFSDLACRGCGICAAECPMQAIDLKGATGKELKAAIRNKDANEGVTSIDPGDPRILAFVCQNSAYESWQHARLMGVDFSQALKLVKVPCAGRVDEDCLLSALAEGFDCVLVLGCHHDSCKAGEGSGRCERRVDALKAFLGRMGLKGDRLMFGTTGPGKPFDFVRAYERARAAASGGPTPVTALSGRGGD